MIVLTLLSVVIWTTQGLPSGAPDGACLTMAPLHYLAFESPMKTPVPYTLVIDNDNNQRVTLSSDLEFGGFLLKAKNVSDSTNTPIGSFKNLPSNTRTACNNAAVTHTSKQPKANLTFEWVPPAGYCGTFVFEATIAFNYSIFWKPIQSQNITIDCQKPTTKSPTTTIKPVTLSLDPECGNTKKCFHDCSDTSCTFLVTYTTTDKEVEFEITAKMYGQADQYAVIGFSDDMSMGRDSVVGCIYSRGAVTVEQSYNPAYYNMPLANQTLGLTVLSTFVNNSYIRCKFRRLIVIPADTQIFDLTSDYYLMFATGPVNSGFINKHGKSPTISQKKYSFEVPSSVNKTLTTTTTSKATTTTTPKPPAITLDSECEKSKRCFHDCGSTSCTYLVTWQVNGQSIDFEMKFLVTNLLDQWVGIGFSSDKSMGSDSVISCIYKSGIVTVEYSYNPGYYNTPLIDKTKGLTLLTGSMQDYVLSCKFRRPVTYIGEPQISNLDKKWFLFLGNGPIITGGSVGKHFTNPYISSRELMFANVTAPSETTTLSSKTTTTTITTTTTKSSTSYTLTLDSECGQSKQCYHDCTQTECTYLVSWWETEQLVQFEIITKMEGTGDQWAGIGLSDDRIMGEDYVVACVYRNGNVVVEQSYNPGHYNQPLANSTLGLSQMSGSIQDSFIKCEFKRDLNVSIYPKIFDLRRSWYLMFAKGPLYSGSIGKHNTRPIVSRDEMIFSKSEIPTPPSSTSTVTTEIIKYTSSAKSKGCFEDEDCKNEKCSRLVSWKSVADDIKFQPSTSFTLTLDSECGQSKQCYHDCTQTECTFLVSWWETGQHVQFQVNARMEGNGDQWAGIGFSDDRIMGEDYVVACMYRNGNVVVEQSYNPGHYNQPLANSTLGLSQMSGSIQDSFIKCEFKRDLNVAINPKIFDLRRSWYLMFAQGPLYSGSIGKHNTRPKVSRDKMIFSKSEIPTPPSSTSEKPTVKTEPSIGVITKDPECSKSKGCFDDCKNEKCSRLVAWKSVADDIEFQIKCAVPNSGNFWSAIAFSSDTKMGDDSVIACIIENGQVKVEQSYNPGYYNAPINDEKIGLTVKTSKFENSVLECTFLRKKNVSDPKVFDLNKKWHLLYATGSSVKVKSLGKHSEVPTSSAGTVDFLVASSVKGTKEDYLLPKVHGCLMVIAWILFASIGIVTARYYKTQWPDSKLLGEKVWFTLHRTSMVIVFLCTCISFVIIFVDVKGYSEIVPPEGLEYLKVHPILGIVVTCLTIINPIMALFRPAPDHKRRPIFNILHWFVGTSALILAVITIFFGLQFEKTGAPISATHVMIAYCVTFVLIELVLEIQRCQALHLSSASDSYEMKPKDETVITTTRIDSIKKDSRLKSWMLSLHILAMLVYSITIVLLILLNKEDD